MKSELLHLERKIMLTNPDTIVLFEWGWITINMTLIMTWVIMFLLVFGSWLLTRKMTSSGELSKGQNILEALVDLINGQIKDVSGKHPGQYLPYIGTLFIFVAISNILTIVPGYIAPTSSLSTTTALALSVFIAVPLFGIANKGILGYLKQYIKPNVFMLPFNILGELSRTLSLAIRLYGNIMSGSIIVGILLSITPLIFPVVMQAFGLLIGVIQAYIFAILAMVYIASASETTKTNEEGGE
jgi:F-type H+-transporting ATPase subunit a